MSERVVDWLARQARFWNVSCASVSIVLPRSVFYDEFLLVRGKREDGSGGPERSFKNVGGGWSPLTIQKYIELSGDPSGIERELEEMRADGSFGNVRAILQIGGLAEVLEETGFLIRPREAGSLIPLVERHLKSKKPAEGRVHLNVIFGSKRVFEGTPKLDDEIFDCISVRLAHMGQGEVSVGGEQIRVSPHHYNAILRAHQVLREESLPDPVVDCSIPGCSLVHAGTRIVTVTRPKARPSESTSGSLGESWMRRSK